MLSSSRGGSPSGSGTHWGNVELVCVGICSTWGFSCTLIGGRTWGRASDWVISVLGLNSCASVEGGGAICVDEAASLTSNKESMSKSMALTAWMRVCSVVDPIKLRRGSVSSKPPPLPASAGNIVNADRLGFTLSIFPFSLWNFFNMLVTLNVRDTFFFLILTSDASLVIGLQVEHGELYVVKLIKRLNQSETGYMVIMR